MNVPFLELKPTYLELRDTLDSAYHRVMDSGWFLFGRELESFEKEFAAFCGVRHCIGVGNGLDAIHLILRSLNIGPGDDVLVPAHTFIATWLAVSYAGARPVPVDIDADSYNIDPALLETAITSHTKAIIAVHLYGQSANMAAINAVARKHGLKVIEDAAQAHGARCHGVRAGGLADAAAFSFYPGKNLGAFSDGGAVTTNNDMLAERVRCVRNYGSKVKYHHDYQGINSRLEELQSAFLRAKLPVLDAWNQRRTQIAQHYLEALAGIPDLILPRVPAWANPVWHLFVIRHPQRDRLQKALADAGIGTLIHYPIPPHLSGAYADMRIAPGTFPVAEASANTVLSLPMGPHLAQDQIVHVCEAVRKAAAALAS